MKRPLDFLVIGAQKAGTTSVFEYLRHHPELWLPPGKEAPYFSHEAAYARGWDDYLRKRFAFADARCMWGTATPSYMYGSVYNGIGNSGADHSNFDERTVPRRIYEQLPNVRLVAILRDPVQRAVSAHRMAAMTGVEQRPFAEAIDALLRPEELERCRQLPDDGNGYVTWGEYGRILAGYLDVFPREQLLVTYMDELEHAPAALLKRIHTFLGVAPDFIPENLGTPYRVGSSTRRLSWLSLHTVSRAATRSNVTRSLWHALPERTRHRTNHAFSRAAYRIDLWNRGSNQDPAANDAAPEALARLGDHYKADTERLGVLLGAAPPWKAPSRSA